MKKQHFYWPSKHLSEANNKRVQGENHVIVKAVQSGPDKLDLYCHLVFGLFLSIFLSHLKYDNL